MVQPENPVEPETPEATRATVRVLDPDGNIVAEYEGITLTAVTDIGGADEEESS